MQDRTVFFFLSLKAHHYFFPVVCAFKDSTNAAFKVGLKIVCLSSLFFQKACLEVVDACKHFIKARSFDFMHLRMDIVKVIFGGGEVSRKKGNP